MAPLKKQKSILMAISARYDGSTGINEDGNDNGHDVHINEDIQSF